ncbi:4-hydroxyphenylpyruvate dioxygenase family protein [Azoarcus sp. KH32C]|uniref:4-hydroxyphenylpyruvate dioxygenase family protein n=1 Tax=Azoarcus sp. KH32C TaxID=748247 RepID=UPI0002385C78|nr:4-hydroxyphenylpyruvate dioxygenase [Azoarcus sp. KH32C]BAL27431.1 4-hydroxyphenylpyruvate dioxygenase [Azoarcus sp. KH32C]
MDGIEFVEFASTDPAALAAHFEQLGFSAVAKHRSKNVVLYRQGDINFLINADEESFAQTFNRAYGPGICAIALRVKNVAAAYKRALASGAWDVPAHAGAMELNIPAVVGVGGTHIYFVDRYGDHTIYDVDFLPLSQDKPPVVPLGLKRVEHVSLNVCAGREQEWVEFHEQVFGFRTTGTTKTGKVWMESPCGKLRLAICPGADSEEGVDPTSVEGIADIGIETDALAAVAAGLRGNAVPLAREPEADAERPGVTRLVTTPVVPPFYFEIVQAAA